MLITIFAIHSILAIYTGTCIAVFTGTWVYSYYLNLLESAEAIMVIYMGTLIVGGLIRGALTARILEIELSKWKSTNNKPMRRDTEADLAATSVGITRDPTRLPTSLNP
jgi:hypothetical protein